MGGRKFGKMIILIILLFMIVWPVYQLYDLLHSKMEKRDATELLYQVSHFQMEMLYSALNETGSVKSSSNLDTLKQSAYAANYTHERLVLAFGEEEMPSLQSLSQLLQYIMRIQIGGERPLKSDEVKTLRHASKLFKEMFAAYSSLLSSGDSVLSTQSQKLTEFDGELTDYLKEKLLE